MTGIWTIFPDQRECAGDLQGRVFFKPPAEPQPDRDARDRGQEVDKQDRAHRPLEAENAARHENEGRRSDADADAGRDLDQQDTPERAVPQARRDILQVGGPGLGIGFGLQPVGHPREGDHDRDGQHYDQEPAHDGDFGELVDRHPEPDNGRQGENEDRPEDIHHLTHTEQSRPFVIVRREIGAPGLMRGLQEGPAGIEKQELCEEDHRTRLVAAPRHVEKEGRDTQEGKADGDPGLSGAAAPVIPVDQHTDNRIGDHVPDARDHEYDANGCKPEAACAGIERRQEGGHRHAHGHDGEGQAAIGDQL